MNDVPDRHKGVALIAKGYKTCLDAGMKIEDIRHLAFTIGSDLQDEIDKSRQEKEPPQAEVIYIADYMPITG